MAPRICTSCPIPHETVDWYRIEYAHPRKGEYECATAHEARIPREVRDFGTGRPPAKIGVVNRPPRPGRRPNLLQLIAQN
jgi:hypothetical protein